MHAIDLEHEVLEGLFNKVSRLIKTPQKSSDDVSIALSELINHVREHFNHEEALMKGSYSGFTPHQADHLKILNDLQKSIMH